MTWPPASSRSSKARARSVVDGALAPQRYMPRRSPRFATVDAVGDMVAIPDGPFAGESLTLHENGHWHLTHPHEVVGRVPWAIQHGARTKQGILVGSYRSGRGLVLDETLHAKELMGPELRCVGFDNRGERIDSYSPPSFANEGYRYGHGCRAGPRAGDPHVHAHTGEVLYHINALWFTDTQFGLLCCHCERYYKDMLDNEAALAAWERGDYDGDSDEADDNDEEDVEEEEEDSVPTDVIEALPRRTFVRFFRQAAPCAICLDEPTTGLTLVRLPCRHEFCEPCITEWLKRKNACPQCRAPIQK